MRKAILFTVCLVLALILTGEAHAADTLTTIERRIAASPVEIGVFVNPDTGAIIAERKGGPQSVSFADVLAAWANSPVGENRAAIIAPYRDSIFTHNHVYGPIELSAADIRFAALFNVREIRVVGYRENRLIVCSLARSGAYWPYYPLTANDFILWNARHSPAFYAAMGYTYTCQ